MKPRQLLQNLSRETTTSQVKPWTYKQGSANYKLAMKSIEVLLTQGKITAKQARRLIAISERKLEFSVKSTSIECNVPPPPPKKQVRGTKDRIMLNQTTGRSIKAQGLPSIVTSSGKQKIRSSGKGLL